MRADRLSVVDDIFFRDHLGEGPVSVMQGLWRFDDRVDPDDVRTIVTGLADGPLTRRVRTSAVPGARRSFVTGGRVAPLWVDPDPVDPADLVGWGDRAAATPLDVVNGPTWVMAMAHLRGGGSLISLTCSHLVADGLGMVATVDDALPHTAKHMDRARDTRASGAQSSSSAALFDDVRDALAIWWTVILGVIASLAATFVDAAVRRELLDALPRRRTGEQNDRHAGSRGSSHRGAESAVVDVDPERFATVAFGHGGSRTALLVSVIGEIALAATAKRPVEVAVPVAVPGAPLGSAVVTIADRDAARDLPGLTAQIADAVRDVRTPGTRRRPSDTPATVVGPPGGMPPELLQVLGDRVARALTADAGAGDALASNLGTLPTAFERLGPHLATGLAVRAVRCAPDGSIAPNTVGLWAGVSCGRLTLSAGAPASEPGLAGVLERALESWGLAAHRW